MAGEESILISLLGTSDPGRGLTARLCARPAGSGAGLRRSGRPVPLRVWAKARDIIVAAILPVLLLTTAQDVWRLKRALAEAPRQRPLRNCALRPP